MKPFSRSILIIMMILPWLTMPFIKKSEFRRFLPAAILMSIITKLLNIVAYKRNWWQFYTSILPKVKAETAFIVGPYFLASFWVLKLAYGKFKKYMIMNGVLHILFAFPGIAFLKWAGIGTLARVNNIQLTGILLLRAVLLYSFQLMVDAVRKRKSVHKRFF
ncbi:hypothetical protein J7I93_00610 [Bacillus sp. ISL-47]|uniref:hypothetical protein n=1 Tax=Bacillus sp. ISL-47 TaxID=2819130 RepID=UPI001BEA2F0D|nr:hypothetical protein [Bacillus sp. ISL-47]MBT2686677.1 hypothetical protein [Bacillus sp. ISL-47]MBT2707069.1 hypothetical protein [Pseudomonas sp. ISL-84]